MSTPLDSARLGPDADPARWFAHLTGRPARWTGLEAGSPADPAAIPLVYDADPLGWLAIDGVGASTDLSVQEQATLKLIAAAFGERRVASGLADEVLTAWNQIAFLYEALKIGTLNSTISVVAERLGALMQVTFRCDNAFVVVRSGAEYVRHTARPLIEATLLGWLELLALSDGVVLRNDHVPPVLAVRVPLDTGGEIAFGLAGPVSGAFLARERQLIENLAGQVGALIDAIALQRRLSASSRLQQELEIAAQIQASLLPRQLLQPAGCEIAGLVVPAAQVGGDFYDVVACADGQYAIMMGDVAGKGMPAALLNSLVRAELRGQVLALPSAGRALARANQALKTDLERLSTFATATLVTLDPVTGRLSLASAGHTPALYWQSRAQMSAEIGSTNLPLGLAPESALTEQALDFMPGDVLILYSDGITEAEDPDGRLFGWQGLEDALLAAHAAPADVILQTLLQAVDAHRREEAMRDDMAILVVRREPRPLPSEAPSHRPFVIPTHYSEVERIQTLLLDLLEPLADRAEHEVWLHETSLALVEHVTNIIRHAYGEAAQGLIYGLLTVANDHVLIETVDRGEAVFDTLMLTRAVAVSNPLDHAREGGYGLAVIRTVMDVLHYERLTSGRNVWRLERRMPDAAAKRSNNPQ